MGCGETLPDSPPLQLTNSLGLPPHARLDRKSQFEYVFAHASQRVQIKPLRMLAAGNRMCTPRLGIVAPKRVLRRAVDRNRAKRHIRESFRQARPGLPALDIVVQVIAAGDVRQAADELWLKLGD